MTTIVAQSVQICSIKSSILPWKFFGQLEFSFLDNENGVGRLTLCVDGLPSDELQRLQIVHVLEDRLARLRLETWYVLQEFNRLTNLLELDLCKTIIEVGATKFCKVDHLVVTGLDCGVAQGVC